MPEFTGIITEPGLYGDMPEDQYHADPVPGGSLSVTGAKKLLPPSCPAIFDHERRHPKMATRSMELGTVVHGLILGTGQPVEVLGYDSYKTKKAQDDRKTAIAAGSVPMLIADYAEAQKIAAAVYAHPLAGALLSEGDAEQSMFWQDPEFGIWCRGRTDSLTYFDQPVIVDVKTTSDASPAEFARSADKYRYYMQDPYYRDGLAAVLGCDPDDIDFVFVVVPTEPPYLPMVYRLEETDVELGRQQNRIAREKYRDCTEAGIWPAWSADITPLALPRYAVSRIESEINDYFG